MERESSAWQRRNKFWALWLIALPLAQVAASLFMQRGTALTITSDLIQCLLLLVATAAYLPNITRSRSTTFHTRLFWILMSAGMVFWLAYQAMWNYFEVIRRQEVPDPFLGDIVLFLHLVPMIAALAVLPHLKEDEHSERSRMLDFTLLLTWWVFVYVYLVIPWQTVAVDEATYSANFNFAYLTEKIVLLASLIALAYSAKGGWRHLYGQLLGASALYASSSYVANWAIGHKTYYSGSVYDIPLTVSIAWMAATPLFAAHYDLSGDKPVETDARNLDHAREHARLVHSAVGGPAFRTGFDCAALGQNLPHHRKLAGDGGDGRHGLLAPAPARRRTRLFPG